MGNPVDSDSFLTSHPGDDVNSVQTQGPFLTFKIKRFPPPGVRNKEDSGTKVQVRVRTFPEHNQLSYTQ